MPVSSLLCTARFPAVQNVENLNNSQPSMPFVPYPSLKCHGRLGDAC